MKYISVGIISFLLSIGLMYLIRPKDNNALIKYQFKQNQIQLDSIEAKYKRLEQADKIIYNRLNIKYEEIDNANTGEFRSLLSDFARRTDRLSPNRTK